MATLPEWRFSVPRYAEDLSSDIDKDRPDLTKNPPLLYITPFNQETSDHCHYTQPMSGNMENCQIGDSTPALRRTSLFASTIQNAQWQPQDEGGYCVVISAMSLSGGELKKALDSKFRGQYSVQV